MFSFSGKKQTGAAPSAASEPEVLDGSIEVETPSRINFSFGIITNILGKDGGAIEPIYRLIPVADHPLFPGSTAGVSVTYDQYKVILESSKIFAGIKKRRTGFCFSCQE